jgi:hypothetical protein
MTADRLTVTWFCSNRFNHRQYSWCIELQRRELATCSLTAFMDRKPLFWQNRHFLTTTVFVGAMGAQFRFKPDVRDILDHC